MGIGVIQPLHLLLILLVIMIVFGAGKLSQVGAALGQSIKEFKASVSDDPDGSVATEGEGDAAPPPPALPAGPEPRPVADPRPATALRREEI